MDSDVSEIKARLNVVDVLGEYIRLDKAGANWRATCPFHNEKTPSFMVSEEKQMWHCFGCQKSGDIFTFVMEMEGLEFRDALKQLAEKAGVKLKSYNPQKAEEKSRTLEILELATKWYDHQLWNGPGKIKILGYLRERGLRDETIKEFRLGYAPSGWRNILTFLTKRGYKTEEIMKTGLLVEKKDAQIQNIPNTKYQIQDTKYYDRFRDRIMFPIADYAGKVVGYSARVAPGQDESQAKYVNTPETEVYHKSRALYGIDKAKGEIKQKDFALLVEGNVDVIAASQAGIKNVIAVSGTALTPEQIGAIGRYTKKIKMFFDMDSAGEQATKKSVKLCFSQNMAVEIVTLPQGKDAADLAKDSPEELKKAINGSLSVMDYFFQKTFRKLDKNELEDKKKIVSELMEIISALENDVEKSHWIKKLSADLDVAESALTNILRKANLKNKIEENSISTLSPEPVIAKSKQEVVSEELIGLMLVSSAVWKEAAKEAKKGTFRPEDSLLNFVLRHGEEVNFDFDVFIRKISDDQKTTAKLEKIFFEKKYRLDLNNNLEEIILGDPISDFRNCLREMVKDEKRKELSRLASDLKMAEERKDHDAVMLLRQEFNRISKELSEFIN